MGSENVFFCQSKEEVVLAFETITGSFVFGDAEGNLHDCVLVQEFARGTEYAVDVVSRNGEHKVAAIWEYDKVGARLYSATKLVQPKTTEDFELLRDLFQFVADMLDTAEVTFGMSHNEVKVYDGDDGRVIRAIEINCRQHNTNFVPLTTSTTGTNQLDMVLSAYLSEEEGEEEEEEEEEEGEANEANVHSDDEDDDEDDDDNENHNVNDNDNDNGNGQMHWNTIPTFPEVSSKAIIVHLRCWVEGTINAINEDILDKIRALDSFAALEIFDDFAMGETVCATTDIKSDAGWVHLIGEQCDEDYAAVKELAKELFETSP